MSDEWPGAAGDTGNVLEGTALGALLSGNGAAAGFSINYERVPQSIADLEHAANYLLIQAQVAQSLANIPAPGVDGVSLNAVAQIGKWASDSGTNNLEANLLAGAKQLQNLAQKLRADLQDLPACRGAERPDNSQPGATPTQSWVGRYEDPIARRAWSWPAR